MGALDNHYVVRTLLNGAVDRTYLLGPRGPEYERVGSNAPTWYLYDGLGRVLGTVDAAGNIVSARKYDVYGAVRQLTGQNGTRHKFVGSLGHPSDDETGLIYMRARYYDPDVGRFVSEDPAADGDNWFAYCRNSPALYLDFNGKQTIVEVGGAGGISGTLDAIGVRIGFYIRNIVTTNNVKSPKALEALAKFGEDPSHWKWVVAEIGGNATGVSSTGWLKAIVCVQGRSAGAYLMMELEGHAIPYGALTGLAGL